MRIDCDPPERQEIDLAPLIDCVFLLLIFFMVATTFKTDEPEPDTLADLEIALPRARALGNPSVSATTYTLNIDASGRYFDATGSRLSTSALHRELKTLAASEPQTQVRIEGDRHAPHQRIVHLVDLCHFVGLDKVSLRVRQQK